MTGPVAASAADLRGPVERFWAAQASGDRDAAAAQLAPELEWVVVGRGHPLARTFRGREAFFGELIAALGRGFRPGSVRLEVLEVLADTERGRVVSRIAETATGTGGEPFEVELITVMSVSDGLIHSCREVMDLGEVARALPISAR